MKTIVIGDIHGRTIWKDIVNQEKEFDKFVFIGDYLDTHENISGEQQLSNLLDIIEFKKANPDKVILLFGNHDFHYLDVNERYSGFQNGYNYIFKDILKRDLKYFQMCYKQDNILITHAGVSEVWCKNNNIDLNQDIEQQINDLFDFKPFSFKFKGNDPYGDSPESSPIWIRLHSLSYYGLSFVQIVGHTTKQNIKEIQGNYGHFTIYPIDCLGTSQEYLVINNNEIQIKSLKTK